MTKTCGKCGHAALDDQAQFCNRCGAAVPEEKKPAFPVCPGCGTVVSDELAQFCNRCGARIPPAPVVCGSCGSPAIDNQSRFCTRCGASFKRQGVQAAYQPGQAPVMITQRKATGPLPPVKVPDTDWEPWNDVPPAYGLSGTSGPAIPEQSVHHDQQIAVPQKRYAHLPLIADELKTKGEAGARQHPPDIPGVSEKKKAASQKKGVLGFLKK